MEGCFMFQWEGEGWGELLFGLGASFLSGGISFGGGGGRGFENNRKIGERPPPPPCPPLWETLFARSHSEKLIH